MTYATATADAGYPAPTADTPMVDPTTIAPDRLRFLARYGDPTWSFLALSQNPSAANDTITWTRCPEVFREPMRHAAWALANFPLSDVEMARHGPSMRSRLSASRMYRTVQDWAKLARWLDGRGITLLSEVTEEDLVAFSKYLADSGLSRNTVVNHLVGLTRLHVYTGHHLAPQHRLLEPPWIGSGMDDYLPASSAGGENVTEPITPDTLGPLLIWSLRMVEDFADDILDARDERHRLIAVAKAVTGVRGAGGDNLETLLRGLKEAGKPIPTSHGPGNDGRSPGLFLAGLTGTSQHRVHSVLRRSEWRDYRLTNPGPCLLDTPIRGRVGGKPWCEGIEFDQVSTLFKHLVDACFIVMAYLTGMRPGEILGLEYGCCPEPEVSGDAPKRYVIRGRQFKYARDEHGNHQSAGEMRDAPWIAVPQVVRAIRVLERVVGPGKLLFDAVTNDRRSHSVRVGRAMATTTTANRIESTIKWINQLAARMGRDNEVIPPDPDGRIGINRFRRTLAWHIARRPGGLVALALQYGHMRTIVSEGYASRSRGGIHDLLDLETARTVAEHLSDVHEAIQSGEGVSGPAARRLINSAAQEHHRFGGMVATVRQARTLLSDPTLNVFDNPEAYLTCNYDPSKALCHPGRDGKRDAPSLDRCVSTCANIARTDTHAKGLEDAAARLLEQADSSLLPTPVADRLRARCGELRTLAERHRDNRITPDRTTAGDIPHSTLEEAGR